ncbi:peroxin 14 [Novymonas esmeraldas]|uniref:Peroxisomal membrane protein PEX14 n=1 Tax=Novymonas esmeraldas TaxID=1808958 RepID=A0AAW0EZB2_9TRYP
MAATTPAPLAEAPPLAESPPLTESPPVPEQQPSAADMEADDTAQSAVRFLRDPRVQRSPIDSQIRFLKGKGVSEAQIRYAFAKVGRAVTAEKIASVRAPVTNAAPAGVANPLSTQLKSARQSTHPAAAAAAAAGPQYTHTLFPHSPPPPPDDPPAKAVDWRDLVIGAGAAVLAGVAGYKLFHRYSPYEFRRKSEKKERLYRGSYPRHRSAHNGSSDSEADVLSSPQRRRVPPLPPPPPSAAAAPEPIVTATPPGDAAEEVKRLQTELSETKEALASERKRCADVAMNAARTRAGKEQLSRANDRLVQQMDELKKSVEKLEEEKKSALAGGATAQAATEETTTTSAAPATPPSTYYPSVTQEGEQARQPPAAPFAAPVSPAAPVPLTEAVVPALPAAVDSTAPPPPPPPPPPAAAEPPIVGVDVAESMG